MYLPPELLEKIYEYDGRYKIQFNKVIEEISTKNNWFLFMKNTLISSMEPYSGIISFETLRELRQAEETTFSIFYFNKFKKKY